MDDQNELVKDFLIESFEYLDTLDEDLLEMEQQSNDPEVIARIFRAVHTIKGTGGFLNFEKLVGIAHVGEELLDAIRKDRVAANSEVVGALFELVDALREVLMSIEETGKDGEELYAELIETLKSLQEGGGIASAPESQSAPASEPAPAKQEEKKPEPDSSSDVEGKDEIVTEFLTQSFGHLENAEKLLKELEEDTFDEALAGDITKHTEIIRGTGGFLSFQNLALLLLAFRNLLKAVGNKKVEFNDDVKSALGDILSGAGQILSNIEFLGTEGDLHFKDLLVTAEQLISGEVPEKPEKEEKQEEKKPAQKEPAAKSTSAAAKKTENAEKTEQKSSKKASSKDKSSLTDNSIRVDVGLLDSLMNLVGELVLTRNQILQFTSENTNLGLANSTQDLNLIVTELQEGVMKTRMQTIGTIWRKFPRVVRDLSKTCNKQARVEMEGEDTELDKTIIEAIKDPLTHLVRNSVDHGIESPEERIKKGKSAEGRLLLHAFHEGGSVIIEITDDGGGINAEKVRDKAIANGVITQAEAARMTERELHGLIFRPGLSTAQAVSNISGRGVGMDVVKTYIERIGGSVEVMSKIDHGTTIRIKIPLTLAIIPALMIKVDKHRFAIPQVNLLELVRLEGEQITREIEMVQETPIYRLRGKLLPLVFLRKELELREDEGQEGVENALDYYKKEAISKQAESKEDPVAINIIVLQAENQVFGLVVDEVIDTEEVVVKPLSKLLKSIPILAGATIMGDGKVALILDVVGMAHKGNVMAKEQNLRKSGRSMAKKESSEHATFLLAKVAETRQLAVLLSAISRLEEIKASQLESAGNQTVVQYRGYLMPLVWLNQVLGGGRSNPDSEDFLQVIVCSKNGLNVGLIVDEIVDVVDERIVVNEKSGIISGVQVIQNQVTEIVSIKDVLERVDTSLFEVTQAVKEEQMIA